MLEMWKKLVSFKKDKFAQIWGGNRHRCAMNRSDLLSLRNRFYDEEEQQEVLCNQAVKVAPDMANRGDKNNQFKSELLKRKTSRPGGVKSPCKELQVVQAPHAACWETCTT